MYYLLHRANAGELWGRLANGYNRLVDAKEAEARAKATSEISGEFKIIRHFAGGKYDDNC